MLAGFAGKLAVQAFSSALPCHELHG